MIIVPRVFRAGTTQKIGVNIFGNKSCEVVITLSDATRPRINAYQKYRFHPNEAATVELKVSLCFLYMIFINLTWKFH